MPHDANGQLLKPGDIVYIPAKVINIQASEEYCNLEVDTLYPMPPYTEPTKIYSINARQVIKEQIVTTDGS